MYKEIRNPIYATFNPRVSVYVCVKLCIICSYYLIISSHFCITWMLHTLWLQLTVLGSPDKVFSNIILIIK